MAKFAQRLKDLRSDKNLTQVDFGAIFNLSKQTISGYEKGDNSPPLETLQKFADYFEVTTDYLLGRSDDPTGLEIDESILEKYIRPTLLSLAQIQSPPDFDDIETIKKAQKNYLVKRFNEVAELRYSNGQLIVVFKKIDPDIVELCNKIKNLPPSKRKVLLLQLIETDSFL